MCVEDDEQFPGLFFIFKKNSLFEFDFQLSAEFEKLVIGGFHVDNNKSLIILP